MYFPCLVYKEDCSLPLPADASSTNQLCMYMYTQCQSGIRDQNYLGQHPILHLSPVPSPRRSPETTHHIPLTNRNLTLQIRSASQHRGLTSALRIPISKIRIPRQKKWEGSQDTGTRVRHAIYGISTLVLNSQRAGRSGGLGVCRRKCFDCTAGLKGVIRES